MVEKRKSPDSLEGVEGVDKTSKKPRETLDKECQNLRDENLKLKNENSKLENENSKLEKDNCEAQVSFEKLNEKLLIDLELSRDKNEIYKYLVDKNSIEINKIDRELLEVTKELNKYQENQQIFNFAGGDMNLPPKFRIILESNIEEIKKRKHKISIETNEYKQILENIKKDKAVRIINLTCTKRFNVIIDMNGDNKIVIPFGTSINQSKINNDNQCIICKINPSEFLYLDGLVSDLRGDTLNCDINQKLFCKECIINHKIKNTSLIEKDNKKVEFGKVSSLSK